MGGPGEGRVMRAHRLLVRNGLEPSDALVIDRLKARPQPATAMGLQRARASRPLPCSAPVRSPTQDPRNRPIAWRSPARGYAASSAVLAPGRQLARLSGSRALSSPAPGVVTRVADHRRESRATCAGARRAVPE